MLFVILSEAKNLELVLPGGAQNDNPRCFASLNMTGWP